MIRGSWPWPVSSRWVKSSMFKEWVKLLRELSNVIKSLPRDWLQAGERQTNLSSISTMGWRGQTAVVDEGVLIIVAGGKKLIWWTIAPSACSPSSSFLLVMHPEMQISESGSSEVGQVSVRAMMCRLVSKTACRIPWILEERLGQSVYSHGQMLRSWCSIAVFSRFVDMGGRNIDPFLRMHVTISPSQAQRLSSFNTSIYITFITCRS